MYETHADHPRILINLSAIGRNYLKVKNDLDPSTTCAVVLKANGYGLGAEPIGKTLESLGCQDFFVASLEEGKELRHHLKTAARIYILHGLLESRIPEYIQYDLTPVLNSPEELIAWNHYGIRHNKVLPALLHLDTGMSRLGFSLKDIQEIMSNPQKISHIKIHYLISHLACSAEKNHPKNDYQLKLLQQTQTYLPQIPLSLAASEGTYLSKEFTLHMVRQGINLYGGVETLDNPLNLEMPIRLQAPILQTRSLKAGDQVGYGGTFTASKEMRIAILAIGYADALPRALSNKGFHGRIGQYHGELLGRISMDLTIMDVTHIPQEILQKNTWVDLIHDTMSLYEVCTKGNTVAHEIFTRLGPRCTRVYIEDKKES